MMNFFLGLILLGQFPRMIYQDIYIDEAIVSRQDIRFAFNNGMLIDIPIINGYWPDISETVQNDIIHRIFDYRRKIIYQPVPSNPNPPLTTPKNTPKPQDNVKKYPPPMQWVPPKPGYMRKSDEVISTPENSNKNGYMKKVNEVPSRVKNESSR